MKSLEELFKDYDGDYIPTEFDWGEDVGLEILDDYDESSIKKDEKKEK